MGWKALDDGPGNANNKLGEPEERVAALTGRIGGMPKRRARQEET